MGTRTLDLKNMNLGELITEMISIAVTDPKVLRERDNVPKRSQNCYEAYCTIRDEVSRREKEYRSALSSL